MLRRRKTKEVLVLVDWENLLRSMDVPPPEKFSLSSGIEKLMDWLESIGEVFGVFVFAPSYMVTGHLEIFHEHGFFTILCPKIPSEGRQEPTDTTDSILISFGEKIISALTQLTHLCIVSGDEDFTPLIKKATQQGLKIAIAAGSHSSLASELISLANKHPVTKKTMVHIFSPTKD